MAAGRIASFLRWEESPREFLHRDETPGTVVTYFDAQKKPRKMTISDDAIQVENASFSWNETPLLRNVSFRIPRGSLVAVVGSVGSGKSSLFLSLLGETRCLGGAVSVRGKLALGEQQPWLLNASIRSNILFSSPFDEQKYRRILSACVLEGDLARLPGRDGFLAGEGGRRLSGGQRARVILARCCYSDAAVILLDDVLAAVDPRVAGELFARCVAGEMAGKTRVLVTSSPEVAGKCDWVIRVENGVVVSLGTSWEKPPRETKQATEEVAKVDETPGEEKKEEGRAPWSAFRLYFESFGRWLLILLLLCFLCVTMCSVASSFLLADWAAEPLCKHDPASLACSEATQCYQSHYRLLFLLSTFLLVMRTLLVLPGRIAASQKLHTRLVETVLAASMTFHDSTPAGTVLNRFARDMNVVDGPLPASLVAFLGYFWQLLGEVAAIALSVSPLMLLVLGVSFLLYLRMHRSFRKPNTDVRRLELQAQAPVLSRFQTILAGLPSIHAFDVLPPFLAETPRLLVVCGHVTQLGQHMATFLTWRSDLLAAAISAATAVVANLLRARLTSGRLGVALTASAGINGLLKYLIQQMVATEANMHSVARMNAYFVSLPRETDQQGLSPPSDWPSQGTVVFDDVQMRYGDGPLVLKGVSFAAQAKETLGVVGRTGAGKSSLATALFRLRPLCGGRILIDEMDVSTLSLRRLRSAMGIVPQEPTLFSGSVRFNVDPRGSHTDEAIWSALESVGMEKHVRELPEALDAAVEEGGRNFSVGERQLLCLARVVLQHPMIVVMDEATASLDEQTQATVMRTIQRDFSDCTVLMVAHRLSTVMDSDKVCVMDGGRVAEFDSPAKLLSSQGLFSQMVNASLLCFCSYTGFCGLFLYWLSFVE